jgi:large subunit ribosomal protein L10
LKGTHKQLMAKKTTVIDELSEKFSKASIIIFTDYRGTESGLNVKDISELRKRFRAVKAEYKIAKNTLIKRALEARGVTGVDEYLKQPTAIVIGYDDPVSATKALVNFAREKKTPLYPEGLPLIKGSYFEGQNMGNATTKGIATMPSKTELLGSLLSLINAPAQKMLGILQASGRDMVNLLDQWNKEREKS